MAVALGLLLTSAPLFSLARAELPSLSPAWTAAQLQLQVSTPEVTRAQSQLDAGDFAGAIRTLEDGLNRGDLSDAQLVELYGLLGLAHLYLGDEAKARDAYEKLLQAVPDYELPRSTPRKVRELYARIKADIRKRRVRPVSLILDPAADSPADRPVIVQAHITDLALGSKAKLFYRRVGNQAFSSLDFLKDRKDPALFSATIPAFELPLEATGYEVEYYVEVSDAAQRRLAGRGDVDQPLRFRVQGRDGSTGANGTASAWYKSPWVIVGAVAVAGGITAGVVVLATRQPSTSLGLTIHVNSP